MDILNCQIYGQVFCENAISSEKPPDGYTWSGETTLCGQRFGKICRKRRNTKKSKSGQSTNRSSTMLENCVVFTSLIQMMKNSRIS